MKTYFRIYKSSMIMLMVLGLLIHSQKLMALPEESQWWSVPKDYCIRVSVSKPCVWHQEIHHFKSKSTMDQSRQSEYQSSEESIQTPSVAFGLNQIPLVNIHQANSQSPLVEQSSLLDSLEEGSITPLQLLLDQSFHIMFKQQF